MTDRIRDIPLVALALVIAATWIGLAFAVGVVDYHGRAAVADQLCNSINELRRDLSEIIETGATEGYIDRNTELYARAAVLRARQRCD